MPRISDLTAATTPLAGTEEVPIVQSGSTVKADLSDIIGLANAIQTFDISASNQSITLGTSYPLHQDVVISWSGGDGTYDLDIDPDTGYTIDGEAAGVWKGEGEGRMVVIRTSGTTWLVKEYCDSDGDNFSGGAKHFAKHRDGRMEQWGIATGSEDLTTSSIGWFRQVAANDIDVIYPLTFDSVETYPSVSQLNQSAGVPVMSNTNPPTVSGFSYYSYRGDSSAGVTVDASWETRGRWK